MITPQEIYDEMNDLVKGIADGLENGEDPLSALVPLWVARLNGRRHVGPEGMGHAIIVEGDLPLLFTCPHGGEKDDGQPYLKREEVLNGGDRRAKMFTLALASLMQEQYGHKPTVIINELDRRYLELNWGWGEKTGEPEPDKRLIPYYDWYHGQIDRSLDDILERSGEGLHISWHTCRSIFKRLKQGSLFQYKHGIVEGDPEKEVVPAPLEVQPQLGQPLIMGTHLRTTIDKERGIDLVLAKSYAEFEIDGFPRGFGVYVPREGDINSLLGGALEVTHALKYRTETRHPIDGVQIEARASVYMSSFEWMLFLSLRAMEEALPHYGVDMRHG